MCEIAIPSRNGVKVHDRLMHPKSALDLHVTDDEPRDCFAAFVWLEQEIVKQLVMTVGGASSPSRERPALRKQMMSNQKALVQMKIR